MAAKTRRGPAVKAGPLFRDKAPAKINLTLRVPGRRADGYHEIESLVVFADFGDRISLKIARELALGVRGPFAKSAGPIESNLVIKAAHALARYVPRLKTGRFTLTKQLPSQAGLGGGSADAAAALRLLTRANRLRLNDPRLMKAARETGADVPVCLDPKPRWMRGIGEILSAPLELPRLHAVLVRPDVALATKDVFRALNAPPLKAGPRGRVPKLPAGRRGLIDCLIAGSNDLEPPARKIASAVSDALALLHAQKDCEIARMSGSGSACFGIFTTHAAASKAARTIRRKQPSWWVKAVVIA